MNISKILLIVFLILPGAVLAQKQGITGTVSLVTGNQMPGPGAKPSAPAGVAREIHIYELTKVSEVEMDGVFVTKIDKKLIRKICSKKNGQFKVKLPAGKYTLLIKEPAGLFANIFDVENNIQPVTVKSGQFVEVAIQINHGAAY